MAELRIVPLGSSISLTVKQRGKAIYSEFFLGGSSSELAVLATILMSETYCVQVYRTIKLWMGLMRSLLTRPPGVIIMGMETFT